MPVAPSDTCDVLIIGGGGAALRAAIAACEADPSLDVLLVTKGELGASGVTATACSDRMAFHATLPSTEPGGSDAWRYHADDIYRIGGLVSDWDLAEVLARNASSAFSYLESLGVPWARNPDGTPAQFVTDGSAYARACYTGPHTANEIHAALLRRLRKLPVRVVDHTMAAELLFDAGGTIAGALVLSEKESSATTISASAVVMATGGAGQVYATNVFPRDCTGDGYAMAYRAGAELVNLEFIQFGLCSVSTGLACSGSMMRALPRLVNDLDETFLARYLSPEDQARACDLIFRKGASWPVSLEEPTHIIDIAVAAEIAQGRRVFLDYAHNPPDYAPERLGPAVQDWYAKRGYRLGDDHGTPLARLRAINPQSVAWLAEHGIDLDIEAKVEVAPAAQHFQGGIKIRTDASTTVAGLYAAGETAGGQHGANRPGGNSLLDGQVFGRIAGGAAARRASRQGGPQHPTPSATPTIAKLASPHGKHPEAVIERVQRMMTANCAVRRTEAGLISTVGELEEMLHMGVALDDDAPARTVEALNILQVAHLVATASLRRDESRGPHLRFENEHATEPLPRRDDRWQRYQVIRQGPKGPIVSLRQPVPKPSRSDA
ncbi:MAG: FAD-binding protein [Anaerolineae bacterium]